MHRFAARNLRNAARQSSVLTTKNSETVNRCFCMPIASIGVALTITPRDEIQIVRGKGDYEFADDRRPFKMRVAEVLLENGVLIGITGPVIEGHDRYRGLMVTLTTR